MEALRLFGNAVIESAGMNYPLSQIKGSSDCEEKEMEKEMDKPRSRLRSIPSVSTLSSSESRSIRKRSSTLDEEALGESISSASTGSKRRRQSSLEDEAV